jgi:acyl-CoA synthetase (AMP-forming)/AMP-acid ligase II
MKLINLLKLTSCKYPDRLAVKDDVCEMTYAQLVLNVDLLSGYLQSSGCLPGVKVALLLPDSVVYFISFFAVSLASATIVPMSSKMTGYEAAKLIKRADVSIVLTENSFTGKLAKYLDDINRVTLITLEYTSTELKIKTVSEGNSVADSDNSDVALMVYTSGTTGLSKIVMLTDDQLISNMFVYRATMDLDGHNIAYCSLPFHHVYCICAQLLTHISLGDTFIVAAKPFFIKDFLKAVQTYRVTITAFVPYMAILMSEYPNPEEFDISSLKYVTLSGAKTPVLVYQKLTKTFSHIKFINTYGMSEAGSRISIAAPQVQSFPIESVGKPIPGVKVRITNSDGSVLAANCVGEVEVKSSGVFKGYFNQPKLTKETIVDSWLKTSDLGKLDSDGNLFLVGRKKEIIISGGNNIHPSEIEECLQENASVREAAVIGVPDKRLEEVPCAFVVAKSGYPAIPSDLMKFCRSRLSSFKMPRSIYFIKEIPKLGTSKIDRGRLKEIASQKIQEIL